MQSARLVAAVADIGSFGDTTPMNRCGYCGRENEDGTTNCPGCGLELAERHGQSSYKMERKLVNRVVGGVICAVAAFIALSSFRQLSDGRKLRAGYATATGVITSRREGMHGVVYYAFKVDGREYRARDVGAARREFGASVEVFYCKRDPSVSSLHDPLVWRPPDWLSVIIPSAVSCLGFCVAAGWINPGRIYSR